MKQLKSFTLDISEPKKIFSCNYCFSGLRIKRIQIPFLSTRPISEWVGLINGFKLSFKSIATDGSSNSFQLDLCGQLSPYHQHPIFDLDFFVPKENENNLQSLSTYFNSLEIELQNQLNNNKLNITVYYEEFAIIS